MENFNYEGTYPGFVNGDWIVDERDGHVWLNIPNVSLLESFPGHMSLHFMETPKAYGDSNLNLSDEIFLVDNFSFDEILERNQPKENVRDYYEVIIGKVLNLEIPNHIPKGVTIGSIIIKNKLDNIPVNVINLRNVLSLNVFRNVKLKFGVAVRVAPYGLNSFKNIDLGNGKSIDVSVFFVDSPLIDFQEKNVRFSSPEDYNSFIDSLPFGDDWFKLYSQMPTYGLDSLVGPMFKLRLSNDGLTTINLEGPVGIVRGFTGIKSIKIPFCPGISAIIRIDSFNDYGTVTPFLNLTNGKNINFNIVTRFIEVNR